MDGKTVEAQASRSIRSAPDRGKRSEDSWIEISSQPSSSSLSSAADEIDRRYAEPTLRRRRQLRQNAPSNLFIEHRSSSAGGVSSQEEFDESESESDRVMTSSNEGILALPLEHVLHPSASPALQSTASDDDDNDENRTAINYPIRDNQCFTPQPNAFSHPPSTTLRHDNAPVAGSYFPSQRARTRPPMSTHHSVPSHPENRRTHMPQNILSPSYDAAAHHDEVLRTSLSTLLSCAAAARRLPKSDNKSGNSTASAQPRPSNRVEPISFRLIPESALPHQSRPSPPALDEPSFKPTLRRGSGSTTTTSSDAHRRASSPLTSDHPTKRKSVPTAHGRSASRERRSLKKARRIGSPSDELVAPTLLTWLVSAGVVVVLSALSFRAGYSMGKEAGRIESGGGGGAGGFAANDHVRSCAREAGRQSLGLKRSLARTAAQV